MTPHSSRIVRRRLSRILRLVETSSNGLRQRITLRNDVEMEEKSSAKSLKRFCGEMAKKIFSIEIDILFRNYIQKKDKILFIPFVNK